MGRVLAISDSASAIHPAMGPSRRSFSRKAALGGRNGDLDMALADVGALSRILQALRFFGRARRAGTAFVVVLDVRS
jgi:hypothetical protein